jgi:pilus assembly protein CpaB
MNTRRTTLLIAIVLALGTGWLTLSYLSSVQRSSQPAGQPQPVLVATQDIPARVPITQSMFQVEQKPGSVIQPGALSDPAKAIGSLSLISIPSGSQIIASEIGTNEAAALPVRLQPGMRAVSIGIDRVKGVSGLAQPGDRVDIIAIPPRQGNAAPYAVTILRGVRILAIGSTLENASATPSPDEENAVTVTLEVTPKQADYLAMADANTTLRLALRSPKEPLNSQPIEQIVWGAAPAPPAPPAAAAPAPVVARAAVAPAPVQPRPAPQGVEVIVGDQITGGSAPQR